MINTDKQKGIGRFPIDGKNSLEKTESGMNILRKRIFRKEYSKQTERFPGFSLQSRRFDSVLRIRRIKNIRLKNQLVTNSTCFF